jgi:hypothetical protein
MQTRNTKRIWMGCLVAASMLLSSSESLAWVHPIGQTLSYYIPGPPPGPELGLCRVETKIWSDASAAFATIQPLRDVACKPGSRGAWVQVVAADPGVALLAGPWAYSTDDWPALSVYPGGFPIFGANYGAINSFGYTHTWSVGIFE